MTLLEGLNKTIQWKVSILHVLCLKTVSVHVRPSHKRGIYPRVWLTHVEQRVELTAGCGVLRLLISRDMTKCIECPHLSDDVTEFLSGLCVEVVIRTEQRCRSYVMFSSISSVWVLPILYYMR